jgi:hypothetical protein
MNLIIFLFFHLFNYTCLRNHHKKIYSVTFTILNTFLIYTSINSNIYPSLYSFAYLSCLISTCYLFIYLLFNFIFISSQK